MVGPKSTRNAVIAENPFTSRGHRHAGAIDDIPRFGGMQLRGVGRSTERNQEAEGQNVTHRICSSREASIRSAVKAIHPTPRLFVRPTGNGVTPGDSSRLGRA